MTLLFNVENRARVYESFKLSILSQIDIMLSMRSSDDIDFKFQSECVKESLLCMEDNTTAFQQFLATVQDRQNVVGHLVAAVKSIPNKWYVTYLTMAHLAPSAKNNVQVLQEFLGLVTERLPGSWFMNVWHC